MSNQTNQQNKHSFSETIHDVVDKLVIKGESAVEKVKEWAGMEITDDIDHIKKKATRMNANQVHNKEEMQQELKNTYKEQQPVAVKEEFKEQKDIIEKAELINKEQAEKKEEMLQELTKEKKEIAAFDEEQGMMDKVKEKFDKTTMNDAMDKVKEVWDTTTTKLTEKTGEVVDKVKEATGIENANDPEYVKGKAMKINPEQANMKQEVQRQLLAEHKPEKPLEMPKEQGQDLQKQRKQEMQKELKKENKQIPAFNEKTSAVDKVKDAIETTTNTIAEKGGSAVEKVKEWTGMKDSKENIQQIKDKAVDKNPEQAKMKQQMQKELLEQNKKESPVNMKKESFTKDQKFGKDEKSKESFQKPITQEKGKFEEKDRKFATDKEKKQYEEMKYSGGIDKKKLADIGFY